MTDPAAPTEIGLTSHVGQAHTVNVDPKRPHIAFVSSSDGVNYDEEGVREANERRRGVRRVERAWTASRSSTSRAA